MGLDYLDLAYAAEPPEGLEVAEVVGSAGELIASGKLRAWGFLNWPPELMVEATEIARRDGVPPPCAAQLAYNLVLRSAVENADAILAATGVSVVASMPLWFGVLTGKYAAGGAAGRIAGDLGKPQLQAALAIAFPLASPRVASVLFGATQPAQVAENVAAVDVLARIGDAELAALRRLGA